MCTYSNTWGELLLLDGLAGILLGVILDLHTCDDTN